MNSSVHISWPQTFLIAYCQMQYRKQQPSHEKGCDHGYLHGIGQFLEKAACQSAHQSERKMNYDCGQRRSNHCREKISDSLFHGKISVYFGIFLMFSVDLFYDNYCIIDNQSYGCRYSSQRHDINSNASKVNEKDTQCQGYRNSQYHHQTGTPSTQEQNHDDESRNSPSE